MRKSRFSDEKILAIVKEGESGRKVADIARAYGITEQTYYRWKSKYRWLELSELQRVKQLEDENRRLKHMVAEQALDIQALKAWWEKSGRAYRETCGGGPPPTGPRHQSPTGLSRPRFEYRDVAL
jgi:putative transposase